MTEPKVFANQTLKSDVVVLPSFMPVPGFGVLPVNSFVIRGRSPVLIDTGLASLQTDFLAELEKAINPSDLEWIWLTHIDADHVGNLAAVLKIAPKARLVTSYLGMGKLGMLGFALDRVYLINPGQILDLKDRQLLALRPPIYDAPETMAVWDSKSKTLFSSDCFGALLQKPIGDVAELKQDDLESGMLSWAAVDAPWTEIVQSARFEAKVLELKKLEIETVLSSHLSPAHNKLDTLLEIIQKAPASPQFVGPDQQALETMMASGV